MTVVPYLFYDSLAKAETTRLRCAIPHDGNYYTIVIRVQQRADQPERAPAATKWTLGAPRGRATVSASSVLWGVLAVFVLRRRGDGHGRYQLATTFEPLFDNLLTRGWNPVTQLRYTVRVEGSCNDTAFMTSMYEYWIMDQRGALMKGGPRDALSSPPSKTLRWAVEAMGWDGMLLPQVAILGTLVSVVASLDREAHVNRQEIPPAPPSPDLDTLAMWEWPQGHGTFPPTAVSIVGVVAHEGRSLRGRIVAARKWRGICPSAVVLPASVKADDGLLLECSYSGISVVQPKGQGVEVVQRGSDKRLPAARRTTVDRWIEEQLYGRLLGELELADTLF